MKNFIATALFIALSLNTGWSQEVREASSAGVIALETRNIEFSPVTLGNILRNELIKMEFFTVVDRYETMAALEELSLKEESCYSRSCLSQVGNHLKVDKMFGGTVDRYGGSIVVSLRVIDIATGEIEHNHVQEFVDLVDELPRMVSLCLHKMYEAKVDQALWSKLTNASDFESTINTPDVQRLSLSGPRMGFGMVFGDDGTVFQAAERNGGFDAWPVVSQFGYQFEISYLNQGNVQALFEFVPTIAGLEQGLFIPSLSILHGVRSNISGLEFAFGPIFLLNRRAKGFFAGDDWYLEEDRHLFPDQEIFIEERMDSRGDLTLDSGLVVAVGRTFRSGKVNFPVNVVTVLKKSGIRLGVSFGFNAAKS
jgi:hypothetical protein